MKFGRRDTTHAAIRAGLRAAGCTVHDTADLGRDFPDLVVGRRGQTWLLEVKGPGGALSDGQAEALQRWRGGPWIVVRSLEEALRVVLGR